MPVIHTLENIPAYFDHRKRTNHKRKENTHMYWIIHSLYDGFVADRDILCFNSNVPKAKKFKSQYEAFIYARKLVDDGKIEVAHVLGFPIEGNEIRKQ